MQVHDSTTVRRFTEDLTDRLHRCDNGEGAQCRNLDESIQIYVQLCGELRAYVNQWARAVFGGEVPFDPAVEVLLKDEARRLLHRAKHLAARGRALDGECYVLQGLNALHYRIADLDYLVENWVSPRRSVSPTPRVKLSRAAEQDVRERLDQLAALPAEWRPSDPEHLALFQKPRAN